MPGRLVTYCSSVPDIPCWTLWLMAQPRGEPAGRAAHASQGWQAQGQHRCSPPPRLHATRGSSDLTTTSPGPSHALHHCSALGREAAAPARSRRCRRQRHPWLPVPEDRPCHHQGLRGHAGPQEGSGLSLSVPTQRRMRGELGASGLRLHLIGHEPTA